jgi:hypothetical protein
MWGNGNTAPPFLTSALDGGEWSASHPCRFTPEERTPSTHWIAGLVGSRTSLDDMEKRKSYTHCRESNLDRPARSQSLCRLPNRIDGLSNANKVIYRDVLKANSTIIIIIITLKPFVGTWPLFEILNSIYNR